MTKKNDYISKVLSKVNYADIHALFATATHTTKEITESYSAFNHLRNLFDKEKLSFNDHWFIHVDDGAYCRTGAMFTFFSKSNNLSIDSILNVNKVVEWIREHQVKRFTGIKHKIETLFNAKDNIQLDPPSILTMKVFKKFLSESMHSYVCVHSHINLKELHSYDNKWKYIFTIPCCDFNNQTFDVQFQYENNISCMLSCQDYNILSPKNMVCIYKNNNNI